MAGFVDRDTDYASLDVLRSVKKYAAEVILGDDWEVRLASEEGAWERPFCRVAWSTPQTLRTIGAHHLEVLRTVNLVLWPTESENADAAIADAESLVDALTAGFAAGLMEDGMNRSTGRRHPLRVPLWPLSAFLDGFPTDGSLLRDPQAWASIVEDPQIGTLDDPDSERSQLVTADLRLRWTRSINFGPQGPDVVVVGAGPPHA